jgi:hemerythrin-like domain-containing protein
MMPIGPLMIEHRLIEKVIELLRIESLKIKLGKKLDPIFIEIAVDFVQTYADRTHHGKEEDILFKDLANRELLEKDLRIMNKLGNDHVLARKVVTELMESKKRFLNGDQNAQRIILENIDALVNLYPTHIQEEDKIFFPAAMKYLNKVEQERMLNEMMAFDQKMIHEKYKKVVDNLQN